MNTKRKLNKDEERISKKSVKRLKKDLKKLEDNLKYNKDLIKLQQKQRDVQDYKNKHNEKWRVYLREQKNEEDDKILKQIQDEIDHTREKIEITEKQIKEGVEQKIPSANQ